MARTSTVEFTGAIIVFVLSVAVALTIGRQAIALYRAWGTTSFQKRHPYLVVAFYCLVFWHLCVDVPLKCGLIIFKQRTVRRDWTLFDFSSTIHDLTLFALILIFLLRFWLLYYDFRFNDIVANLAWRLSIQPTYIEQNWWLINRSTMGNMSYCAFVCFIGWFFGSAMYILVIKLPNSVSLQLIGFIVLIMFVIPTVLAFATLIFYVREIGDGYNIRKELTLCFKVLFVTFFIYFIIAIIGRVFYRSDDSDSSYSQYVLLSSAVTIIAEGSIAYIKAYYITVAPYRTDKIDQELLDSLDDVPLVEILSERTSFESFMKHLISEFSVENLLFLCEVQQYRRQLKYVRIEAENMFESVPEIKLDWMPMSAYLRHRDPWLGLSYVYYKYIHKDSPHQINISAQTYKKLASFFPSTIEWSTPKLLATAAPKTSSGGPSPLLVSSSGIVDSGKDNRSKTIIKYPWQKKSKKKTGSVFKHSNFFRASSFGKNSGSSSQSEDLSSYNMTSKPGKTLFQLYFPQKFERKAVLVETVKDEANSSLSEDAMVATLSDEKKYLSPDYTNNGNNSGGKGTDRKMLGQHGKSKSANALMSQPLRPPIKSKGHAKSSASMMSEPVRVAWSRPQSVGGNSSISQMFSKEGRRSTSSITSAFGTGAHTVNQHYEYHEVVDEKLYQVGTALYTLVSSVRKGAQKYASRHGPPYTRELARVIQRMGGYVRILRQSHNFAGMSQASKVALISTNRSVPLYDHAKTYKAGVTPYHIGDDAKFFGRQEQSVSMLSEFPFVESHKRINPSSSQVLSDDGRESLVGGPAGHLTDIVEDSVEEDRMTMFGIGSPSTTEVGSPSSTMDSRLTHSSTAKSSRTLATSSASVPIGDIAGLSKHKSWDAEAMEQAKSLHSELTEREKRFLMALNGETMGESLPDMAETVFEIDEDLALDKHTLYHMFDRPEKEIWQLMNDSLMRYQQTLTYEQLAVARSYRTGKVAKRSMGVETMKKKLTHIWDGVKTSIYVRNQTIDSGSASADLKEMLLNPSEDQPSKSGSLSYVE